MQVTVYAKFRAIHDAEWSFPDPWIFVRREIHLPDSSVQGVKARIAHDNQSVLPLNWLFLPCI